MSIFTSPDEEQIKKLKAKLRADRSEFEEQKADYVANLDVLKHREQELSFAESELKKERERLEIIRAQIETRREELIHAEEEAANSFAETQRNTFERVIQKKRKDNETRAKELEDFQTRLAEREAAVTKREGEVSRRELDVTGREQKVDAGLPDKVHALAEETRRKEKAIQEESKRLEDWAEALSKKECELEAFKGELAKRDAEVKAAEARRDADFADKRMALTQELSEQKEAAIVDLSKRKQDILSALESEVSRVRAQHFREMEEAVEKERSARLGKLDSEIASRIEKADKREKELVALDDKLKESQARVDRSQRSLDEQKASFEHERERLLSKIEKKEEELEETINSRAQQQCQSERNDLRNKLSDLIKTNDRLTQELKDQSETIRRLEAFDRKIGNRTQEEIEKLFNEAGKKEEALKDARDELAKRPTCEEHNALKNDFEALKRANQVRESQWTESETLRSQISVLEAEKAQLLFDQGQLNYWKSRAEELNERLQRETAAFEPQIEREKRIEIIRKGIPDFPTIKESSVPSSETGWLDGIWQSCVEYGIRFPKRILYAFHTALKTAEISPITVLAGVSGTGKSELPRLYSHFGGLYFEPVSVQPNWDSQESMLGFFNSIDNTFEAQRLLKFLAQSQSVTDEKCANGLKDKMCMVLLDEMNLAHPELYFAEFLSKFETRRGMADDAVPSIEIKLGTKVDPYQLPLGRNILWTGTMNQDETTKSLSDKVLDRAIVIYFPRPETLVSRPVLKELDDTNRGPLMTWATWDSWVKKRVSFSQKTDSEQEAYSGEKIQTWDLIRPYKELLQNINKYLGTVGRAIGHRVWQSVEAYMGAYPGMAEALKEKDVESIKQLMHTSFEDQLVQKVMPKLRGIDTRGNSRTYCLDEIRKVFKREVDGRDFTTLDKDFNLALNLGYGQFMWQSANYIADEDPDA